VNTLVVNVCAKINTVNNYCNPTDGICEISSGFGNLGSIGSYSTSFSATDEGVLVMTYPSGFTCQGIITFTCDEASGIGTPVLSSVTGTCTYNLSWKTAHACPKSTLVTLNSLLDDFIEGKTVKVVYNYSKCSNQLAGMGGATVQSYQYFSRGVVPEIPEAHLVFTETELEMTVGDVLVNKVVTTRIYEHQEVILTTHFFDVNTGKPALNSTVVTCHFGRDTDGVVFNIGD